MSDLDPHWDWIEVTAMGDREPRYIRGPCRHLETEPVTTLDGQPAAQLCLTCDAQLPPGRAA